MSGPWPRSQHGQRRPSPLPTLTYWGIAQALQAAPAALTGAAAGAVGAGVVLGARRAQPGAEVAVGVAGARRAEPGAGAVVGVAWEAVVQGRGRSAAACLSMATRSLQLSSRQLYLGLSSPPVAGRRS